MNRLKLFATKLILNSIEREKGIEVLAKFKRTTNLRRTVSTHKGSSDGPVGQGELEDEHVIFAPKPENHSEKLQTEMKNKTECASQPSPTWAPKLEKPKEMITEPIPHLQHKYEYVQTKPKPTPHIYFEPPRREIFRQVVKESIFTQNPNEIRPPKMLSSPSFTRKNSTFSKIEQTLSKMLTTAIFGFIAYWTWL